MSKDDKKIKGNFKKALKGGDMNSVGSKLGETILAQPLEVKVYNNNFDKALRAFRALVQKERILSAYKEKQAYEKPSQERRRKKNEMKRKLLEAHTDKQRRNNGESFVE